MNKLIISIVPRNTADILTEEANKAGARGGTILVGTGTSANSVIQFLGLGSSEQDILYTIVDEKIELDVINAIKTKCENNRLVSAKNGAIFSMDVTDFIRGGKNSTDKETSKKENSDMSSENNYTMITAIVNKGYAEDAMAAARNAGAKGGTILAAHGTAREGDAKFFGVEIVPEKDMLLILVPKADTQKILDAIQNLECLQKAGSGITFCTEVDNFTLLGKSK
ncbi:MAG: transcriptional regulator [Treponemataceae bacterium]|nr:transcriptional regulator [Treponemataceae bacterium]